MWSLTYLGHSGFLFETDTAYFIFDYIRGELPVFAPEKRLYVFASHAHHDHWDPGIFTDGQLRYADSFILGFDIREPFEEMAGKDKQLAGLPVIWAYPEQTVRTDDFTCTPLLSTDEGVAFPVITEKDVIYHAGDLNWWHWNGDPEERNLERAQNFKRETDCLKGLHIDAACIPLDPRQEDAYRFCMDYCMETLDADRVFPMHFWKDYELCRKYQQSIKQQHPDWYDRFQLISYEGERFPCSIMEI